MNGNELKQVCESIKENYPTLISVEFGKDKENKELTLGFKDFSPKKEEEEPVFNLSARVFKTEDQPPFGIGLGDEIVEVYLFFGALKFDDIDLIKNLIQFESGLTYKKNLQLITINAGDNNVGLVLRSYIDVEQNQEEFTSKLFHVMKEFLSFHYTMKYMATKSKINETLDDEEMIQSLLQKHQKTIQLLLEPKTPESL